MTVEEMITAVLGLAELYGFKAVMLVLFSVWWVRQGWPFIANLLSTWQGQSIAVRREQIIAMNELAAEIRADRIGRGTIHQEYFAGLAQRDAIFHERMAELTRAINRILDQLPAKKRPGPGRAV